MLKGIYLHHPEGSNPYQQGKDHGYYFRRDMELVDFTDKPENIEKKLKEKIREIDADFICAGYGGNIHQLKSVKKFGIPFILGTNDWYGLFEEAFRETVEKLDIDAILTSQKCFIPAYKHRLGGNLDFFWLKWGIDPNINKDYELKKKTDIMFSGKFSTYQFRRELDYILLLDRNLIYRRYRPFHKTGISFEDYSKNLNRTWIGIGGCTQRKDYAYYNNSYIGYNFPKNLEILACKSCLLTSHFGDEKELGFIDEENCLLFSTLDEAILKIRKYLKDKERLKEITETGYKLVHKKYKIKDTCKDFYKQLELTYG